jgi:16S rRNA A1518/A1519 N6-dimethyltransferase RsmA/KsgA/DIM1 with predicted DNA glycosylase/AP lyase activity
VVPTDANERVFGQFVKKCVEERTKYAKKTLDNLFWKELCNATYGKTAQGLKEKRVYDLRSKKSVKLPPSKITNPFYGLASKKRTPIQAALLVFSFG